MSVDDRIKIERELEAWTLEFEPVTHGMADELCLTHRSRNDLIERCERLLEDHRREWVTGMNQLIKEASENQQYSREVAIASMRYFVYILSK